ncbi:GTP cyclohydrolase I FolE2 [Dactylosporangium roseum]|uniref:GTP cyclohydrolase FolE2 n=1 Tax=Dactylosporangium roseum TaxID=47989 RepID=A0ABY5Z6P1_9ACTN|nr:GTP cyclohydrolase FolE2 [Dactylosporangium roseum]UWZ36393.1 GTP cyclohydrolase I FolE2 [Dactylosporangium roseum]
MSLIDVQALPDTRGVGLDEVGVDGLRYPVLVCDGHGNKRDTVATMTMSVDVAREVKGAHLSRFVEVLHAWRDQLSAASLVLMTDDLRHRMGSGRATVATAFVYFLERRAPATGAVSFMDYPCTVTATVGPDGSVVRLRVEVAVTSVCPCSKAISDRGAHNQRGRVIVDVELADPDDGLWFDELVDIAERSASSPLYALLKRPDERHVTMAAYDNPVFVEDMARNVAVALRHDRRVVRGSVRVVNDESIHNHAAYAQVSWSCADQGGDDAEARH